MPKRRFQKGTFIKVKDGGMYSMHYIDVVAPDGTTTTKQKKQFIGNIRDMSERAGRREHALIMEKINLDRGSMRQLRRGKRLRMLLPSGDRQSLRTCPPRLCGSANPIYEITSWLDSGGPL